MMLNTQYMPVPKNIKRKKLLIDDVPFQYPFNNSYRYFDAQAELLEGAPTHFLASSTPTVLNGVPSTFRNSSSSPFVIMAEERRRSEATLRSLVGQQETTQDELNVARIGTIESMAKFLSTYSDMIAPEIKAQHFGRQGALPISAIKSRLEGTPQDKRELLSGLIARSSLADNYKSFHEVEQQSRQMRRGEAMDAARMRTTRTTDPRINVPIENSNEPMRDYLMNAIPHPSLSLLPDDPFAQTFDEPFGRLETSE
jgi:hypothetical protein